MATITTLLWLKKQMTIRHLHCATLNIWVLQYHLNINHALQMILKSVITMCIIRQRRERLEIAACRPYLYIRIVYNLNQPKNKFIGH